MDLHHLRYFVAIAEALSFSRAAVALDISQPALSRQMRDLERELGAPLFNREGRRISLTQAGVSLLQPARASLAEAERGRQSVREVIEARGGSLTIGSSPQSAATILAPVLGSFTARFPLAMLRVVE